MRSPPPIDIGSLILIKRLTTVIFRVTHNVRVEFSLRSSQTDACLSICPPRVCHALSSRNGKLTRFSLPSITN